VLSAAVGENIVVQKSMLNYVLKATETDKLRMAGVSVENIVVLYVLSISKKRIRKRFK